PLARVELDAVVVRGEDLVAVEVDGAGAVLLDPQGVAEAGDPVVADDVPVALDVDAVVVGVHTAVVAVDLRPDEPALHDVVAEVEVPLVRLGADPEPHVADVEAARDVPFRAVPLEAEPAGGIPERQTLDVD